MPDLHAIFFETPIENNYLGHIFSEIYKDRVYAPFLEGKKDLTIIDIGANIGDTSYYFSQFAKHVYSPEPSLEHFGTMTMMLEHNKIKNIRPINKAIWLKSGKLPFYHNQNRTMYSLHQSVNDNSSPPEMVECISFTDLFKENKIEHVDFMKLDVEGSEYEVLAGTDFKAVADKIDKIVIERHRWANRNPNQLVDTLRMRGFNVNQIPSDADLLLASK